MAKTTSTQSTKKRSARLNSVFQRSTKALQWKEAGMIILSRINA